MKKILKVDSSKSSLKLGKPSFDVNNEELKQKIYKEFLKEGKR